MTAADYELLSELGRGGMGVVHRARHRATGALRAVKVSTAAANPEALERFRREAEALARAGGEGVVPVHESGLEGGRLYIVMGLMAKGSLGDRLRARSRLDWREAVGIAARLARSLERCHGAGIVHRDLKPENVLFDDDDRPRLADFGAARDLSAASLTETGTVIGTPAYMPPEQLNGERVDERADVYALGVVLYELVTGALPTTEGTVFKLMQEKRSGRWKCVRETAPEAPVALDLLIARALAPERASRIASAGALARELEGLLARTRGGRGPFALAGLASVLVVALAAAAAVRVSVGGATPPLEARRPDAVVPSLPPPPPPVALAEPRGDRDWLAELVASARTEPPAWFTKLPLDARPGLLPPGILYSETPGEYLNDRDGSVLVYLPGEDCCFVGKRPVEYQQFLRFSEKAPGEAPREHGGGNVHRGADSVVEPAADWRNPRGDGKAPEAEAPVCQIGWEEARVYCRWAGGSLPTRKRLKGLEGLKPLRWDGRDMKLGRFEKRGHLLHEGRQVDSDLMEWLEGELEIVAGERRRPCFQPKLYLVEGSVSFENSNHSWGEGDVRDDMGFRLCRDP